MRNKAALLSALFLQGCFATTADKEIRTVNVHSSCEGNVVEVSLSMDVGNKDLSISR